MRSAAQSRPKLSYRSMPSSAWRRRPPPDQPPRLWGLGSGACPTVSPPCSPTATATSRRSCSTARMGTLLQDRGLDDGAPASCGTSIAPTTSVPATRSTPRPGARVLTTNTFGGTRPRLQMHGLEDRVHELSRAGAALAREVADRYDAPRRRRPRPHRRAHGAARHAHRRGRPADLRGAAPRARGGRHRPGADRDDERPRGGARRGRAPPTASRPDLPVVATLSFDTNLRTMMGVRPADAVSRWPPTGVDAVGANCGRGPEEMAVDRRADGRGPARRASCWRRSPTRGCRRWSATTSSTTRRRRPWPSTPARAPGRSASTSSAAAAARRRRTSPR